MRIYFRNHSGSTKDVQAEDLNNNNRLVFDRVLRVGQTEPTYVEPSNAGYANVRRRYRISGEINWNPWVISELLNENDIVDVY